jgi:hypothetical protein
MPRRGKPLFPEEFRLPGNDVSGTQSESPDPRAAERRPVSPLKASMRAGRRNHGTGDIGFLSADQCNYLHDLGDAA